MSHVPNVRTRLRPWLALAAGLTMIAGCVTFGPKPAPPSPAIPEARGLDRAEAVADLIEAHNRARAAKGLPALRRNGSLSLAAERHADDMAGHRWMSHRGSDGSSPFRRMTAAGYRYERAGENVAQGQPTVAAVMSAWWKSPGHKKNILGKFREIGAGYATDSRGTPYWCVTFGTPIAP